MIYINGESVAPVGNININTEHNYSTDEQVIGTWIDGKPLYEKTVVINNFSISSAIKQYAHNISNLDFGFVEIAIGKRNSSTFANADASTKNYTNSYVFGFVNSGSSMKQIVIGVDDTNIIVRHSGDNDSDAAYDLICVVKYTKSTDGGAE